MTTGAAPATESVPAEIAGFLRDIRRETATVIVGMDDLVDGLLIALLARGHALVEGVPGLAKTLAVKTFSRALGGTFGRIQFTPDLLPADLIGSNIFLPDTGTFRVAKGPVFANVLLADEVNRAPAKVQSALLEAMEEHRVTIAGQTFPLPEPFLVMATQNPIEHAGTYPLPEAQMDRFMLKVTVDYPARDEERAIIDRMSHPREAPEARPVCDLSILPDARDALDRVYLAEDITEYILDLVVATRPGRQASLSPRRRDFDAARYASLIEYGASPRAGLALTLASKAKAMLSGRMFVLPDDVKAVAPAVLSHRIIPTYEAEAEGITVPVLVNRLLGDLRAP